MTPSYSFFGGRYTSRSISRCSLSRITGDGGGESKNGSSTTASIARLDFPSFANDEGHVPSRIHPALRICIYQTAFNVNHDRRQRKGDVRPIPAASAVSTSLNPSTSATRPPTLPAARLYHSPPPPARPSTSPIYPNSTARRSMVDWALSSPSVGGKRGVRTTEVSPVLLQTRTGSQRGRGVSRWNRRGSSRSVMIRLLSSAGRVPSCVLTRCRVGFSGRVG